jgi:hypothetical protein
MRITPVFDIGTITRLIIDPITFEATPVPADPATLAAVRLRASVVVRDANGQLYGFASTAAPVGRPAEDVIVRLGEATGTTASAAAQAGIALGLDGPVEVVGLGMEVFMPRETAATGGVVGIARISAAADAVGPWTELPFAVGGAWNARMAEGLRPLRDVSADQADGLTVRLTGTGLNGSILRTDDRGASARLSFVPRALASSGEPVPVIANRAFAAVTGASVGDSITVTLAGGHQTLTVVGVVESFPTTDPARPLLVLDESTLGLLRLQGTGAARNADEWWLATANGAADGAVDDLAGVLRSRPWDSVEVVSAAGRAHSLSTDPVALGIIGALSLGFVVTGLFAVVGLTVGATLSARQRRTEFALLRALGLSGGQLSRSLWLENGSSVLVSLVAGTGLGLLIGWLALPSITVTQRATAPVPPVLVEVPWDRILLLDVVGALAFGIGLIVIGAVLRRLGVGSILRMGED